MNLSFQQYLLALTSVLSLGVANAQMCPGDHKTLMHEVEYNVTITCEHMEIEADTYLGIDFQENAGIFAGMYAGAWCVDIDRRVLCDGDFGVDSYSSYDNPNIPPKAIDQPENLDEVNWLINHHEVDSDIDIDGCYTGKLKWQEYQMAIWTLMDGAERANETAQESVERKHCVVNWLVDEAMTIGKDFEVTCGKHEKIGMILVIDDDTGYIHKQVMMAEMIIDDIPAICQCSADSDDDDDDGKDGYVTGDPHFKTWSGELYDFHGLCDLTLLTNPHFNDGLGMDINVRSKQLKQFSYISNAVVRIGGDTFEAGGSKGGDTYWLNGEQGPVGGLLEVGASIAGYPITFLQVNKNQREYTIHISEEEQIVLVVWKDFVRVDVKGARSDNFHGSLGLMGSFDQNGVKMGRDGVTTFGDDVNRFGMNWQVPADEAQLFHSVEGPQNPETCVLPAKALLKRRLAESTITLAEAELACSRLSSKEDKDLCVFDVMATNDLDVAGAY